MAGQRRGRWDGKPVRYRHRDALSEIDPLEFERLLASYYRDEGYDVTLSGTGNGRSTFDGGVDLRLRKDGLLTLVQCKRENVYQVTHNVVHELLGIKVNESAAGAIVITAGEFTDAARRAADTGHVRLIDGIELRRMLGGRLDGLPWRRSAAASDYVPVWEPLVLAEERPRLRASRGARKGHDLSDWKFFAALGTLVVVGLLQHCAGSRLVASISAPQRAETVAPTNAAEPAHYSPTQDPVAGQSPADSPASGSDVIPAQKQVSAAEQARRDEEMRRYLDRVPEVTHYRYSPLEQNRDSAPVPTDSQGESGR